MLPIAAVLVMMIAIAGCCVYISYRVGQGISPTSRILERRLAEVETAIARTEGSVPEARQRNREENDTQARLLMEGFSEASATNIASLSRRVEDVSERLNGVRVDVSRDSRDLRDEIQDALRSLQVGARENFEQLARMQIESLERIAGQIRELGYEDERRHESGRTSLEGIGFDLKTVYATSVKELREELDAHVSYLRATVAQIG